MIFDASALVKIFIDEDGSEEARLLAFSAGEIHVPAHALAEFGEILCRKVALGQASREQCALGLTAALRLVRSTPLDGLIVRAADIALALRLSVYDALYLTLAEERSENLATADLRLVRGVKGTAFERFVRPVSAES